jgi:hypothetical protein
MPLFRGGFAYDQRHEFSLSALDQSVEGLDHELGSCPGAGHLICGLSASNYFNYPNLNS